MAPEDEINQYIVSQRGDYNAATLKASNEFVAVDGYRLHARTYWPSSTAIKTGDTIVSLPTTVSAGPGSSLAAVKGVVVFIHGHGSNINRPFHPHIARSVISDGYVYGTLDFPCHGHSDGLRTFVPSTTLLVDSVERYIEAIYDEHSSSPDFFVPKPPSEGGISRLDASKVPVYLIGHSMGGAVALLLGERLKRSKFTFLGSVLLCPLIHIKQVPPAAFPLVKWIGRLLPFDPIPLNSKPRAPADEYMRFIQYDADAANNPHGLGDNSPIRFATLASFVQFAEDVKGILTEVDYRFVVVHDPADSLVSVVGSEALVRVSKTAESRKQMIQIDGGHDFLSMRLGRVTEIIMAFLREASSTGV